MTRWQANKSKAATAFVAQIAVVFVAGVMLVYWISDYFARSPLVVYCAHDAVYADEILKRFERKTDIHVVVRYDTEATKSLGLVSLLIQEKRHPRCDVFWNNQILGTIQLKEAGVLLPYRGSGFDRIPNRFKDPEAYWTGFAARLRVYIVNTQHMAADESAVRETLNGDLSRTAIAKPLYGTTLSHYSILWDRWGGEALKKWHRDIRARGIREVAGNATVKNIVAQGVCVLGFTDSDDFFVAKDAGEPVEMLPIRLDDQSTICIPNSVAIIRGTQRQAEAQQLVDYLLSAETELELARSKSRQIPLGPVAEQHIPDDVRMLKAWAADAVDLTGLGPARSACLEWLKSEYLR